MNREIAPAPQNDVLLLVVPVVLRQQDGKTLLDTQACNGIERWAENFEGVIFASPLMPEHLASKESYTVWRDVDSLKCRDRVRFFPLPWAYRWGQFAAAVNPTRKLLASLVPQAQYLHLSLSGCAGDWAAITAIEAYRQRRAFAVHADRVEYNVQLAMEPRPTFKKRIKGLVEYPIIRTYQQSIIRRSTVGLWHGQDCYTAYSPYCTKNFLVHDIHTKRADFITREGFMQKAERALTDKTLRVIYAGRASAMKGPLEWVRALRYARDFGADFTAAWLGDGPLMDDTRKFAADLDMAEIITFTGFIEERSRLLENLRNAHLLMFTHLTPESPRCLIESFVSGTPIVGYESSYAQNLLEGYGGGIFVPVRNAQALGRLIADLAQDRQRLAQLIRDAGENGTRWNDEDVFRHRSDILKQSLP